MKITSSVNTASKAHQELTTHDHLSFWIYVNHLLQELFANVKVPSDLYSLMLDLHKDLAKLNKRILQELVLDPSPNKRVQKIFPSFDPSLSLTRTAI